MPPDLIPVDHDPFTELPISLEPVEHDPFESAHGTGPQGNVAGSLAAIGGNLGQRAADWYQRQPSWLEQMGAMQQRADQYPLGVLDPAMRSQAGGLLGGFTGSTTPKAGIRAFHGSPHDFEAFDMSKIGTGEGAQAYGHGLYFAENEGTARSYKDAMRVTDMDWPVSGTDYKLPAWVARTAQTPEGLEDVRNNFLGRVKENQDQLAAGDWNAQTRLYHTQRVVDALDAVKGGAELKKPGKMYEVNINADPEHFLDWDKPLSEQHPKVQEALTKAPARAAADHFGYDPAEFAALPRDRQQDLIGKTPQSAYDLGNMTGATAYQQLSTPGERYSAQHFDSSAAAQRLRDAGIPGIKYLDQGSRTTAGGELIDVSQGPTGWHSKIRMNRPNGEQYFTTSAPHPTREAAEKWAQDKISNAGTHNYVVFNDRLIDIVRKYGIAGLIAGGVHHFSTTPVDHDPYAQ